MNSISYLDSILSRSLTSSRSGSGSNTPARSSAEAGHGHLNRRASDYSLAREREREKRRIAASLGLTSLDGGDAGSHRKSSKRSSRKSSKTSSARHSESEQGGDGAARSSGADEALFKLSRRARHSEGSEEPIGASRHPKSYSEGFDDDRRGRLKRAGSTPAPTHPSPSTRGWTSLWGFGSYLEGSTAASGGGLGGSYDGYMRRTLSGSSRASREGGDGMGGDGQGSLLGRRASTGDAASAAHFAAFAPDALLSEREREDVVDLEGYDPEDDLQPAPIAPPSTPYPSTTAALAPEKLSQPTTPTDQQQSASTKITSLLFGALNPLTDDYFGPQAAARSAHSKRRASEASEKKRRAGRSRVGSHGSKDSHSEASSSGHGHEGSGGSEKSKKVTAVVEAVGGGGAVQELNTHSDTVDPPPPYGEHSSGQCASSTTLVTPSASDPESGTQSASAKYVSLPRQSNVVIRGLKSSLAFLKRLLLIILLGPYRAYQLARQDEKGAQIEAQAYARVAPVVAEVPQPSAANGLTVQEKRTGPQDGKKQDEKAVVEGVIASDSDSEEVITEDQAAARAAVVTNEHPTTPDEGATHQRPRASSRLLPNPNPVDPLLAHDRNAKVLEVAAEAEMKARRRKQEQSRAAVVSRGPMSSLIHHSPKVLVLDLDETLIHSTSRSPTWGALADKSKSRLAVTTGGSLLGLEGLGGVLGLRGQVGVRPHQVEVVLDGRSIIYHVYKRPHVDTFLRKVASWYHVVVFTASVQEYADPVIDWLDQGRGLISARLFRESCTYRSGSYYKNLSLVDSDLSRVCLVDNSPASYLINQANGIPIEGWTHDPNDEALLDLLPVLDSLRFASDVRHILGIRGFSDLASRSAAARG